MKNSSKMKMYSLPDDLLDEPLSDTDEIVIRYYTSDRNSFKHRIVLNRNVINLLLSGSKTIVYSNSTAIVHQGELVVLPTGNVLTSEMINDAKQFSSILIYFSNQVFDRFLIKYEHLLRGINQNASKQPFLVTQQNAFIKRFCVSLQESLNSPCPFSAEIWQLRIEELLLYILQKDPEKFCTIQMVTDDKQHLQIRKTVESQIGQSVSVGDLAFLCHMSTSTFKRKFNEIFQTTPQKWLLIKKLELAASLLRSSDERPSEVYLKVGYQSHSSFTEAFRNHFGTTPSNFQKRHLNAVA